MKTCPECKAEMPMDAAECPQCGEKMPMDDMPDMEGDKEHRDKHMPQPLSLVDSILAIPTITESIENGSPVHRGKLLVSVADRLNRNRRIYPESVWRREAANAAEKVRAGLLTGQAEHPQGRPELLNTILKFTGVQYNESNKTVFAEFQVIPTAKGRDFIEIAKAGVAVGCSTRGTGSVQHEKRNGQEVSVIQDDYNLLGIDIMLMNEQSVENAAMLQFESVELQFPTEPLPEPHMPDKTEPSRKDGIESLVALREAYPDLLTEAEQPHREALSAAQTANAELTEKLAAKDAEAEQAKAAFEKELSEANDAKAKLAEQVSAKTVEVATLTEQNEKLNKELNEAVSRKDALLHLFEVAREKKHAAWMIVELLKDAPTTAVVDESLPAVERRAASLIETTLVAGQGVQVAKPEDDNRQPPPEKEDVAAQFPNAMSIAFGRRIPA